LVRRFRRRVRALSVDDAREAAAAGELLDRVAREQGCRRIPALRITRAVPAPAVSGLLRTEILLPPSTLQRLDETELRLVLLHELAHLRRRDLWLHWLLTLLQAVHWFNPVLWWAFHRLRVEAESAADAWALQRCGDETPLRYGETLLRLLETEQPPRRVAIPGVVGVVESARDLRSRIRAIGRFSRRKSRLATAGAASLLVGLAAAGLTQAPKETPDKAAAPAAPAEQAPADIGKLAFTCLVRDEAGNPVSGAAVFFQLNSQPLSFAGYPGAVLTAVSDAEGKAAVFLDRIGNLPKVVGGEWFARHETKGIGASGYRYHIPVAEPDTDEIVLSKGTAMPLKVVDDAGLLIAGLGLRVVGLVNDDGSYAAGLHGEELKGFWTATTDAQGECVFLGVPEGMNLYVDHADERYAQPEGRHHWEFRFVAGNTEPHVLRLEPAATISGRVVLSDGSPVAGALVKTLEQDYVRGGCSDETVTDAEGHYVLKRLLATEYDVRIMLPEALREDWAEPVLVGIALEQGQHFEASDIVITPGALVTGRVIFPDTGKGVPDFRVETTSPDTFIASPLVRWWTMTDAEGNYRLRLTPGERNIGPFPGTAPAGYRIPKGGERNFALREGDRQVVDFALERTPVAIDREGTLAYQDRSGNGSKVAMQKVLDAEKPAPQNQAAAPAPADTGKLALTCLVRDEAGNPVSGAEVFFQPDLQPMGFGGYPSKVLTATTDGEGKAVLSLGPFESLPKQLGGEWFARHGTKGMATSGYRSFQIPSATVELVLCEGAAMPLKVVDEAGLPVAGLELRAIDLVEIDPLEFEAHFCQPCEALKDFWSATTDAKGECVIRGLPEGMKIHVDHSDERYAQPERQRNVNLRLESGNTEAHLIQLERAATISGRVTFPDGSPVAGATVRALEQYHYRGGCSDETTTDADGRYVLKRLLAFAYDIGVTFPEALQKDWAQPAHTEISLEKGQPFEAPDIVLTPGALVTGRVTLPDTGEGVPDFMVGGIELGLSSYLAPWRTKTDAEGNYRFRLSPGERRVYLAGGAPEGYSRPKRNEKDLTLREGDRRVVDFTLAGSSELTGRVLDEDGNPVAGATVRFRLPLSPGHKWLSGEDGSFLIDLREELDDVKLFAYRDDWLSTKSVAAAPGKEVEIRLSKSGPGRAEGRVINEEGTPIAGATVTWHGAFDRRGTLTGETTTDDEGRFVAERVIPDEGIGFSAAAAGYRETTQHLDIEGGKTATVPDLVLRELAKAGKPIVGRVVDAKGEPVRDADVWTEDERQPEAHQLSDEEGRFRFEGIVMGWIWVKAANDGKQTRVRVRAGTEDVVVHLPEEANPSQPEEIVDFTGKPAPPLRVDRWLHDESPDPEHKGKIRMIQFIGKDRSLLHFYDTVRLMQELQGEFAGKDVEFLLVHSPWPTEEVEEILATDHPNRTVPLAIESEEGAMSDAFGVRHWLTIVTDREGKVVYQDRNGNGSKAAVQKLLDAEKE
ncbi:MAG TPA: carboxypeptidase regulatory-like domain-containing protein, partial [Bacteroidia bacterium]|nr:carboxypeptidase regulatory-like domain-containing protein [Bacteroidia bacterium]